MLNLEAVMKHGNWFWFGGRAVVSIEKCSFWHIERGEVAKLAGAGWGGKIGTNVHGGARIEAGFW